MQPPEPNAPKRLTLRKVFEYDLNRIRKGDNPNLKYKGTLALIEKIIKGELDENIILDNVKEADFVANILYVAPQDFGYKKDGVLDLSLDTLSDSDNFTELLELIWSLINDEQVADDIVNNLSYGDEDAFNELIATLKFMTSDPQSYTKEQFFEESLRGLKVIIEAINEAKK